MPGPNRQPIYSDEVSMNLINYNAYVELYLLGPFLSILLITIFINLLSKYLSHHRRSIAAKYIGKERPSAACSRTGKGCTRWLPSTILASGRKMGCRKSRIAEYFGLSALGEVIVIAIYFISNLLLVVCGAEGSIDFMAHHAARLVYANLPLVIGLASKNNFIAWATGISYEALNVYHRAISRLVFLLSFIHVFGRVYINYPPIDFTAPGVQPHYQVIYDPLTFAAQMNRSGGGYLIAGTIGFISFSLMIVLASRSFRNAWYQFFIISHVFLFLLGTVALCIHRPSIAPWLYAGFIIYFIDRVIRTFKIVYYHLISFVSPSDVPDNPIGMVEALSSELIRVTVQTTLSWYPGQHVYLHCPLISAGGHPFSVCSIDKALTQTSSTSPRISTAVLLIRVREGLTRRLYDLTQGDLESTISPTITLVDENLESKSKSTSNPIYPNAIISPIWLEGPYGNLSSLDYYQTLLLISGGSGVSFTLPILLDYVRRARAMRLGFGDISVATERLTFVWIIKKESQIDWIRSILMEAISLAPPNFLRIFIHITADPNFQLSSTPEPAPLPPSIKKESLSITELLVESTLPLAQAIIAEKNTVEERGIVSEAVEEIETTTVLENTTTSSIPSATTPTSTVVENCLILRKGRPNVAEILEEQINLTDYSDFIALGACGPTAMTEDIANAVSNAIHLDKVLKGEKRRNIRLHVEEFGW